MKSIIYILSLLSCLLPVSLIAQSNGFKFVSAGDSIGLFLGTLAVGNMTIDPVDDGGSAIIDYKIKRGIIPGKEYTITAKNSFQKLNLIGNQLTKLDVSDLKTLKGLWCDNNLLESLDVSELKYIDDLSFSENKISSMDLTGLDMLKDVICFNNNFSVCGLDSLFLSLSERAYNDGTIYIAHNNLENEVNNRCRTYIAIDKKWAVMELKDDNQKDVSIVNSVFSCESTFIPKLTQKDLEINIFPNPISNILNIQSLDNIKEISLYDLSGKLLASENVNNFDFSLQTASLNAGMYVLKVQTESEIRSFKIVKE